MKPKTMILMVVAVVCGLGASYMTSKLLAERSKQEQAEPTVPVLVATARMPAWQPIKEPDRFFEVRQFPQSVAPPKALTELADVKDKRLNKALDIGKPVTEADLLSKEQMSLAENLLPGQRAIAIKVSPESLVAGFVLPTTRVDVVCTTRGKEASARIILQNMLVLAVDTQDQRPTEQKSILGQTVTLAATPEESTRLALAQSTGELRLLLKGGADTKRTYNVVSHLKDFDKPLMGSDRDPEEMRPSAPTVLPSLPKEDPTTAARVNEKVEPVKKRKRHIMTIVQGTTREKAIFVLGDNNSDDDEDAPNPPRKEKEDKPKVEAKKPEAPSSAPTNPPKPSPFGKSIRAGKIQ